MCFEPWHHEKRLDVHHVWYGRFKRAAWPIWSIHSRFNFIESVGIWNPWKGVFWFVRRGNSILWNWETKRKIDFLIQWFQKFCWTYKQKANCFSDGSKFQIITFAFIYYFISRRLLTWLGLKARMAKKILKKRNSLIRHFPSWILF